MKSILITVLALTAITEPPITMSKLADYQQEKSKLVEEARSIWDKAESENRLKDGDLTGDDLTNYEQRENRIAEISKKMEREIQLRDYEDELVKNDQQRRLDDDDDEKRKLNSGKLGGADDDEIRDRIAELEGRGGFQQFATDQYRAAFQYYLATNQNVGNRIQFEYINSDQARSAIDPLKANLLKAGINEDEFRALDLTTNPGGGAIVPTVFRDNLIAELKVANPLRAIANVLTTTNTEKLPLQSGAVTAAWQGAPSTEITGSDPDFKQQDLEAWTMAGLSKQPLQLLSDANIDLMSFLAEDFTGEFGELEAAAMFAGDGTNKPTGILSNADLIAGQHTFAAAGALTFDDIIDLEYGLPEAHRNRIRANKSLGTFIIHSSTEKALRKIKDGDSNYIWQSGNVRENVPNMLNGYRVITSDNVETIATTNKTVLFGDFRRGYTIGDRGAMMMQRLNELFMVNLQHGIMLWRRVDGIVRDHNALIMGVQA